MTQWNITRHKNDTMEHDKGQGSYNEHMTQDKKDTKEHDTMEHDIGQERRSDVYHRRSV